MKMDFCLPIIKKIICIPQYVEMSELSSVIVRISLYHILLARQILLQVLGKKVWGYLGKSVLSTKKVVYAAI